MNIAPFFYPVSQKTGFVVVTPLILLFLYEKGKTQASSLFPEFVL